MDGNKALYRNNDGVTLVEVIISLLILAMIFTPMISSFVTANKVNKRTAEMNYATSIAENVMEAVKVMGVEGTARQFAVTGAAFTIAKGTGGAPAYSVSGGAAGWFTGSEAAGYTFVGSSDGVYNYRIEGAIEGTELYDMDISISAQDYEDTAETSPKYNGYAFADLSAFNSKSSILVNPGATAASTDDLYNTKVVGDFYEDYVQYTIDSYEALLDTIRAHNDALPGAPLGSYGEAGKRWPEPAYPTTYNYETFVGKITKIEKVFTLGLAKERLYSGDNVLRVYSEIAYKLTSGDTALFGGSAQITYYEESNYPLLDREGNPLNYDSVYLMYSPYNAAKEQKVHFADNEIIINNFSNVTGVKDFYIAVQKGTYMATEGEGVLVERPQIYDDTQRLKIKLDPSCTGECNVFSEVLMSTTNVTEKNTMLNNAANKRIPRIFTVDITIYNQDGDIIKELSSSMVEY